MEIGTRIKEIRKKQGLTQDILARKLGVKRAVISKYETGSVSLSVEQLRRIADLLEVSEGYLLTGDPNYTTAWDDFSDIIDAPTALSPERISQAYQKAPPPVQRTVEVALEPFMEKEE